MSHSSEVAFIRWQASRAGANLPVDTAQSRDNLIGNVQHAYDEHFQHRASWISHSASLFFQPTGDSATVPQYVHRIFFPYSIRHDGTAAPLVIRLFGRVATASNTVTWYLGLRAPLESVRQPGGGGGNETTVQHTSTTAAWADTAATTIAFDSTQISVAEQSLQSRAALAGDPVYVRQVAARLDIYCTVTGATEAELLGWLVREYVGT